MHDHIFIELVLNKVQIERNLLDPLIILLIFSK